MDDPQPSAVIGELARRCGRRWRTIEKADVAAQEECLRLADAVNSKNLAPADTALVVFGSLARGEWTQGSDRDWTLLVDGPVDVQHAEAAKRISEIVAADKKSPGPTGVFGGLTFSHEIVHFIGGDDDTNTNTTRRILLLLESRSLIDDGIRRRVLKALLQRYIGEDLEYHEPANFLVPRFLLNDYVRYWRTMAVDSAQKRRDRSEKWALRNVKLRLSRKLIFAAGLWACFSCKLCPSEDLQKSRDADDRDGVLADITEFLLSFSQQTPLETLAHALLHYDALDSAALLFDAYDQFLRLLDEEHLRKELEELKVEDAMSNDTFSLAKNIASDFQDALATLFFNTDSDLTIAAQTHGVF